MDLSIVIPTYNEEGNIEKLYAEIASALSTTKTKHEIVFVDDGSSDNTFKVLENLAKKDSAVKIIKFRRNYGQTAAMLAGLQNAKGDFVVTMDADLQNDPKDIPKLLKKLNEGYDLVCGWRMNRRDTFGKRISSKLSNILMSFLMDLNIHDSGCTLRAYRKEILENFKIYGETHRYIPAIISSQGGKVAEVAVNHRERHAGKTKYGLARLPKGLLDLITLKFISTYGSRPIHVFGGFGLGLFGLGFLGGLYLTYQKFALGYAIANRPLLMLVMLLLILGALFVMNGFIAELLIRNRETQSYKIEKIVGK